MKKKLTKIPNSISFTNQGFQTLLNEKEKLLNERKIAVEELKKAREMGDLKENGYYRGAKAKLSSIDRKLRELNFLIRYGKITENYSKETVGIGSKVLLESGEMSEYTIVGSYETNPSENKISLSSPLGKELIGKKTGESIIINTPSGEIKYKVLKISYD